MRRFVGIYIFGAVLSLSSITPGLASDLSVVAPQLPQEILTHIGDYLPFDDLKRSRTVAKQWAQGLRLSMLKRPVTFGRRMLGWGHDPEFLLSFLNREKIDNIFLSLKFCNVPDTLMQHIVDLSAMITALELNDGNLNSHQLNKILSHNRLVFLGLGDSVRCKLLQKSFTTLSPAHSLRTLELSGFAVKEQDVALFLMRIPGLAHLRIRGLQVSSPDFLDQLLALQHLESLELTHASMQQDGWEMLMGMNQKIRCLDLSHAEGLKTVYLSYLQQNENMHALNLEKTGIGGEVFLKTEGCFNNLNEMNLSGNSLMSLEGTPQYLQAFAQFKNLNILDVSFCQLRNKSMPLFAKLTHLSSIVLSCNRDLDDSGFEHLSSLILLTQLKVAATRITGVSLRAFSKAGMSLMDLDLESCTKLSGTLADTQMTSLKNLNMSNCEIVNDDVRALVDGLLVSGDAQLESINLSCNRKFKFSNQCVADLGRLQSLTQVNLNRTNMGSLMLGHLMQLTHLRKLHLEETKIGDDLYDYLEHFPELTRIDLRSTDVSKGKKFKALMKSRSNLELNWGD